MTIDINAVVKELEMQKTHSIFKDGSYHCGLPGIMSYNVMKLWQDYIDKLSELIVAMKEYENDRD